MVVFTKQQVLAKISQISNMDMTELDDFGLKVSMSDVDPKAKFYLYKAIDLRIEELEKKIDFEVVNGDLSDLDFQ